MHQITETSLSDAYINMLSNTLTEPFPCFMQVTMVAKPILGNCLNDDEKVRAAFESYTFPKSKTEKVMTGKNWIDNRIKALLDAKGEYWGRMNREGQLDYVTSALKGWNITKKQEENAKKKQKKTPTWNANRIMISLFNPARDLHIYRVPAPPCLSSLCFYPVRKSLSLIATFRAQYSDIKAYGNLISLAMLLKDISEETGLTPATIHSVAHKAILKHPRLVGKELLNKLLAARG